MIKIKTSAIFILFICFLVLNQRSITAEILHLHDGQVLNGSIVKETKKYIIFKTEFQTKKIKHKDIKRIVYGEHKLEQIYLHLKNGNIVHGYIADQNADVIKIKANPQDKNEITILKSSIKEMSQQKIVPMQVSAKVRAGLFMPLNSSGSNLQISPIFFGGSGMFFASTDAVRLHFEFGYTKPAGSIEESDTAGSPSLQLLLFSVAFEYTYTTKHFSLVPVVGIGFANLKFDDGNSSSSSGFASIARAGLALQKDLFSKDFLVSLAAEYTPIYDTKTLLHSVVFSFGMDYRF